MAGPFDPVPTDPAEDRLSLSLTRLVERFGRMVRHVARGFSLADEDVDELLQEVRIRVWKARGQAGDESVGSLGASYVYQTARAAALDLLRRRRHTAVETDYTAVPERAAVDPQTPARRAEQVQLVEQVQAALDALGESRKLVVRLHLAGYPRQEIAGLLKYSQTRTRNLLYRGLADLREELTRRGIGPEEGTWTTGD